VRRLRRWTIEAVKWVRRYRKHVTIGTVAALIGLAVTLNEKGWLPYRPTKHAVLSVRLGSPMRGDDGTEWQRLMVHNDGDKTADSFEWYVLIPKSAPIEGAIGQPGDDVTVDGVVYSRRWRRHIVPLHAKGDPHHLVSIRVKRDAADTATKVPVLWYIRSDDRTFPGLNKDGTVKYGRIELPG
jgi:hypothetical protein